MKINADYTEDTAMPMMTVKELKSLQELGVLNDDVGTRAGIKETQELIKALAALTVRTVKNLRDDGKISVTEGIGYLAELGTIKEALNGIQRVPEEVMDLTTSEMLVLRAEIRKGLIEAGVTHRLADITDKAVAWLNETLVFARFIINAPPTALLA